MTTKVMTLSAAVELLCELEAERELLTSERERMQTALKAGGVRIDALYYEIADATLAVIDAAKNEV